MIMKLKQEGVDSLFFRAGGGTQDLRLAKQALSHPGPGIYFTDDKTKAQVPECPEKSCTLPTQAIAVSLGHYQLLDYRMTS